MAITASQAQGLVLALFGASAGGHLTGLTAASSLTTLAADLSMSAGLILDRDLSSNTAFRDLVLTTNLKLTGTALTEAQKWMDGEFTKGSARADILAAAVTFLDGLTDTTNAFYATAAAYRTTVTNAVTWSQGAGATVTSVATLMAQQGTSSSAQGQTFTLTTGTTDLLIGTAGNDTFTGASTTFQSTDRIVDASATDADTLNLTGLTADATPSVSGVETINVNFASTAARVLNLGAAAGANLAATNNVSGVTNLTVTRDDVVVGGSTILGEKTVNVQYLNADKVAKVTAGAATKNLTVSQVDKAGVTIDGNVATGDVSVAGAATINVAAAASATGGTVTVTALASGGNASGVTASASTALAENAKPVTVNAAVAKGITLANGANGETFTGAIAVTAPEALFVTVPAGSGGVTVNAAKGASIVDANGVALNVQTGIDVRGISSKGADITTGAYAAKTNGVASAGQITIGGTAATSDKATVSAAGSISLTVNAVAQVDKVTLKGNGAAVTYTVGANAATGAATTSYTLAGDQNVTLSIDAAKVDTATVVDSTDGKTTTLKLTSTGTATYDLSAVSVDNLLVSSSATSSVFTVASGATVQLGADQTTSVEVAGVAAGSTLNLQTADDTAASGATIDIVTAELKATNATKLNIDATVGKLTATKLTAAATTDVVITGNKAVNLDSAGNGTASVAKSVDASALTAALTYSTATSANVTSGSGADTLKLSDGGNGTAAVTYNTGAGNDAVTITKATKGVTVNTDTGNDTVTLTAADSTATVNTGAGNDTINGTTISGVATVDAGDGNDSITIAGAMGAAGSVYIGGAGNDSIGISNTASLVVDAGTGDDTVTVSADVDSVIVGGDGTDTLNISSASDFTTAGANDNFAFTGFETVDASGANGTVTIKASVVSGQTFTLQDDGGATVVLNGTATANTIDLSGITRVAGTDVASLTIDAGAGNDTVTGTALGETIMGTVGADTLTAGAGTDTISYAGAADNTDAGTQTGVVVNLGTTAITASTVGASGVGVLADSVASVAANTAAYIYAAAGATNSANVDTLSGFENITGSAGADYLVGDANANTITGGAGSDTLYGGAGADTFAFSGVTAATNGSDAIKDFVIATDILSFAGTGTTFSLANAATGTTITLASTAALATEGTSIAVAAGKLYMAEVADADVAGITSVASLVTTLANGGVLDAVDITQGAGNKAILVLKSATGTTTYVYGFADDAVAATVDAGELTLIGTLTSAADGTFLTTSFAY
jgi:hypothetical protein